MDSSSYVTSLPPFDDADWRTQITSDSRQRIVDKIFESLKRRHPLASKEQLQELHDIAARFEGKIYNAATSQSDYLRKISIKMLSVEATTRSPIEPRCDFPPSSKEWEIPSDNPSIGSSSLHPLLPVDSEDWRNQLKLESRGTIIDKITETLKRYLPLSGEEGLQELRKIAIRFEEKTYSAATSQSDYLRKISSKLLTVVSKSQNTLPLTSTSDSGGGGSGIG